MNVCTLFLILASAPSELTAAQIIERATQNNAFGFADGIGVVSLTLQKKDRSPRVRQLEIRSRGNEGALRTRVRFLAPAEVAGTSFLVLERPGSEDEQYLYLPALGKTKRITGRQRDDKFMGTDLTYADIQAKNVRTARLQRLADDTVAGAAAFVVQAQPSDAQDSPYSKTVTWVHQEAFVPVKVEFYDRSGRLLKVLTVQKLHQQAGRWVAVQSQVHDVQNDSSTQVRLDRVSFDALPPDSDFVPGALAGG